VAILAWFYVVRSLYEKRKFITRDSTKKETMLHHMQSIVSYIQSISPVDEGSIKSFVARSSLKTFAKNEFFIREGELCDRLLFIHKGIFRYFVAHEGNDFIKDFAVDSRNPFCTSLTSFISKKPSDIFIEAMEDTTASLWPEPVVTSFLESNLDWAIFAKKLMELLYMMKEKREIAFLKLSAKERYLQFRVDFPQLEQRIPQFSVASYLGITPESLSRIRRRLTQKS
jgi:CRP-like cAMP-binding protein